MTSARQSGPVLEGSSVRPGASARAEQFVHQVTVTALDVDKVEARLVRELGGTNVALPEFL